MLVHLPVPTYHFHEIVRVCGNPSRHYGGVQWVFNPPVHSLPSACTGKQRAPLIRNENIRVEWSAEFEVFHAHR